MLKNYIKIAFRNLKRNRIFSFINIFGLSIGLACCILIMLFVNSELSYDSFHKNTDRIFRISLFENYAEDDQHFNSITSASLGPLLKDYFPEIENYIRVSVLQGQVSYGARSFPENYHLTDPDFFSVFNFPLIEGNPEKVLADPNSVVITESYAKKYFGDSNPVGKTLTIKLDEKPEDFVVAAVAKDVPDNSSVKFNIVIPFQKMKEIFSEQALHSLTIILCETYVFTSTGITGKQMEAKTPSLIKSIAGIDYRPGELNLLFQPIEDIHLDTSFPVGLEPISSPVYSYVLSIIGLFILLIAIINFVTLSISKSASRAGEVGIRKVVGANRKQLINQYWGESLLLVLISSIVGLFVVELTLPFFNTLVGKNLQLSYGPETILIFLSIILLTGLASGIYPAIVLSSFNPIQALKGKMKFGGRSTIRQVMVGGQFTISVILITGTIAVFNQIEFVKNKNLGFDKENVLVIPAKLSIDEIFKTSDLLKNELSKNENVASTSVALTPLGKKWSMIGFDMPDGSYKRFYLNTVDYDYLKTTGIKLLRGRDFSKNFSTDYDEAVIVNEAFIKQFNLQNNVNGKMPGNFVNKIIGVVKDFNFESLHSEVKPAVIALNYKPIFQAANDIDPDFEPAFLVRIKSGEIKSTLEYIKNTWNKVVPDVPYEGTFLNDSIEKQYRSEEQLTTIIIASSVLSILITCLGLLGLSLLIILQKKKEIGIRRMLGASVASIYKMLSKEFLWLIIASQFIGMPVSYYLINKWLEGFAYRIEVGLIIFIIAAFITISIALVTISYQSIKAATENPVNSLRYE